MSSLRLVIECQNRGLLTKEAAESVLQKRNALIHTAMRKQAAELVASIQRLEVGETKEAAGGFLGRGGGGGGFLSKFKTGGISRGGSWGDVVSNLTKMVALAGLTAGATTGVGAIMHHSRDKKLRGRIQGSYKQMFEEFPELKDMRESPEGQRIVDRNFGILAEVAPSLAAIPAVAGTFVRSKGIQQRFDPQDIAQLADTQRRIDEMHTAHRGEGPKMSPLQLHGLVDRAMSTGGGGGGHTGTP